MRFRHDLGDGLALRLRDPSTAERMHELTLANLERLREWEEWAHGPQSLEGMRLFTRQQLEGWVAGRALPVVLELEGVLVGAVGARIDPWGGTAEVGYWVDADHEGRGAVGRGAAAVVAELLSRPDVDRVEIRTSTHNLRSRAVAERLGFRHEGTLAAAKRVGAARHDVAVYGRVAPG
ncbi:GNAT family N-acetyltransferase [Nocardioides solisilvae]|uniref:GNAT family N-acetyltransferase n=1 Tax=Nocardioides solisilvae TaxID=1542435 RepID=UPI000D743B97|nr:GNAT family protein [Nocardioides solisilvae]